MIEGAWRRRFRAFLPALPKSFEANEPRQHTCPGNSGNSCGFFNKFLVMLHLNLGGNERGTNIAARESCRRES
jgi:hypothetical protein